MAARTALRHIAAAAFGIGVGTLFLWLALEQVDVNELRAVAALVDLRLVTVAALFYWTALILRVCRWQTLLRQIAPAPLLQVLETLVVGYAVNNLLPARLGEVVRAAYAKRRLGIGRARVFGSIVVERFLDLAAILSCLIIGLIAFRMVERSAPLPTFELIALNAGGVIGVVMLGMFAIRSGDLQRLRIPDPVLAVINDFRYGLGTLNRRSGALVGALSVLIWFFEVAALVWMFAAFGVELEGYQAMLVMGAASLSTLVPTAPGYLGTYQLVFVLAMSSFGYNGSIGIVTSTACQVVLFGSVSIVGLAILGARSLRRLVLLSGRRADTQAPSPRARTG